MKRIAFITDENNFMVNSIKSTLEELKHEVIVTKPLLSAINKTIPHVDLIFLFVVGMGNTAAANLVVFLKDICFENDKRIVICGDDVELRIMRENLPTTLITGVVSKPFMIEAFKKDMERIVDAIDNESDRRKILIIDDNMTSLVKTQKILEKNYNVRIAKSAADGIICLSRSKPDLILVDYMMPVCDGLQFFRMIRGETEMQNIPVMFLTGVKDIEKTKEALLEKPADYSLKDISAVEFQNKIDQFFKKRIGMSK